MRFASQSIMATLSSWAIIGCLDVFTDNNASHWMLHHPKVTLKMARRLTFFSQLEFTLHHVEGTTNVVGDALFWPGIDVQGTLTSYINQPQVLDCAAMCASSVIAASIRRSYARLPASTKIVFAMCMTFRGWVWHTMLAHTKYSKEISVIKFSASS